MVSTYSNVTLTSQGGDLSVVVYLPHGVNPNEPTFYYSSRFDHGSMIGSISRRVRYRDAEGHEQVRTHILFETDMWRIPHNSNWPESGVGLAAEFGVGDDGSFCYYRCGWTYANDVTNGVLGYTEAKLGESFLKIGVGELIKGSCPACDSTEDYKFNSPYLFAKPPKWEMYMPNEQTVQLTHEASLNNHGYKLIKEISLVDKTLTVRNTLTNQGTDAFSTVWYSHNFFACDSNAIGPGYAIDLKIKGDGDNVYQEPGTWSWSTPLEDYAIVQKLADSVRVRMIRALNPGVRIKAEFVDDGSTKGAFQLRACQTAIDSSIPELSQELSGLSMYAYNLYIERATFSPEPQILLHLNPGETITWTQKLIIDDLPPVQTNPFLRPIASLTSPSTSLSSRHSWSLLVAASCLVILVLNSFFRRRRHGYTTISEMT